MDFSAFVPARINNSAFDYFPRFSNSECYRLALSALYRNSPTLDNDFASLSDVGDEIFEKLNDHPHRGLRSVRNQENDGQIQFIRILQRSDNVVAGTRKGDPKSHFPQKPTYTRIVRRRETLPDVKSSAKTSFRNSFPGAQPKWNGSSKDRGQQCPTSITSFRCAFCISNGETEIFFTSHPLRDAEDRVVCPILQKYKCYRCGATGESAHTNKYCPESNQPLPKSKPIRRNAVGKRVVSYN